MPKNNTHKSRETLLNRALLSVGVALLWLVMDFFGHNIFDTDFIFNPWLKLVIISSAVFITSFLIDRYGSIGAWITAFVASIALQTLYITQFETSYALMMVVSHALMVFVALAIIEPQHLFNKWNVFILGGSAIVLLFIFTQTFAIGADDLQNNFTIYAPDSSLALINSTINDSCTPLGLQQQWATIFNKGRFTILNRCSQVTGTVASITSTPAGDALILLSPDILYENLTFGGNFLSQNGNLVVKVVCAAPPTLPLISNCGSFINNVTLPQVGDPVLVTGTYVLEKTKNWAEIHPALSITLIPTLLSNDINSTI